MFRNECPGFAAVQPGGDDRYHLGNEVLVWPSAQLPDRNASLGQGAGYGNTAGSGLALLMDAAGDDRYRAQVFAQGAGLRHGLGALLDLGGHNRHQAAWYAMGAAAHQGVGLLWAAGAGGDSYEVSHVTAMGAGHDGAVGLLVDGGGSDRFVLDDLGLVPALRWLGRTLAKPAGVTVDVEAGDLPDLDEDTRTLVFRVAQEALTNSIRHASAEHAGFRLSADGSRLRFEAWDDGRGFDPARALQATRSGEGSGLGAMRERVTLHGGKLQLTTHPGAGTRLRLEVPLSGDDGRLAP